MADDDLLIRAALRDELSAPLRGVQAEVRGVRREVERLNREQVRTGRGVTGLGRTVDRLGTRLNRVGDSVAGLSSRLSRGLVTAAKVGGVALAGLAAGLGLFGARTAANLETAMVSLEAITGSAKAAEASFDFLKRLDPKAPFDIGQLLQLQTVLASSGLEGRALERSIQGVVDVASATANPGENLERIALAIGQIRSSGTLLTQDLNQLVQAGVPVGQALEKAFGMSLGEFRKAQASGSLGLDPDKFVESLFGMRAGVAEKVATETLTGLLSGVKSRVMLKLAEDAQPLLDSIKGSLPAIESLIGAVIDDVGPPVFRLLGQLADLLAKGVPILGPVFATALDGIGRLVAAAGPALTALEPVMADLSLALVELVDALVPVMPELVRGFVAMVGVLPDFVRLLAALVPILDPIARLVTVLLEFGPIRGLMAGLLTVLLGYSALAGPTKAVWGMVAAVRALGTAQAVSGAAGAAGGAAGAAGRFGLPLMGAAGAHGAGLLTVGALGTAAGVGVAAAGGALIGTHIARSRAGHGLRDWIGDRMGTGTLAEGATTAASVRANLASSAGPAGITSTTNVAPGAVVVNNPRSTVDLKRAVADGIGEYERDKAERSATTGARG